MKKIISMIMSAVSVFSMNGLNSSAIGCEIDRTSDCYKEWFDGYSEFDDNGFLARFAEMEYKAYYNEETDSLMIDQFLPDYFEYKIPDDANYTRAVGLAMQNAPEWNVSTGKIGEDIVAVTVYIQNTDSNENYNKVVEFSKKLKEVTDVIEFRYYNDLSSPKAVPMKCSALEYSFAAAPEFFGENGCDQITSYVESLGADYEAVISDTSLKLVPASETTIEERIGLMKAINDEFGVFVSCGSSPSSAGDTESIADGIDMADNVYGDANCDSRITICDAVAILQYVANPEKYPLSKQGKFNADLVGGNDGITGLDALEIQKYDAGLTDNFT